MAPVRPAGGRTLHSRSELFRGHVGCRLSLQGTLRGPETEGVWAWMRQTLPAILALGLWPHSWSSWSFCSLIPYPQLMQSMDEDSFGKGPGSRWGVDCGSRDVSVGWGGSQRYTLMCAHCCVTLGTIFIFSGTWCPYGSQISQCMLFFLSHSFPVFC